VGNVNHTTISNFEDAISRNTKAILISHRSNFFLRGEDTRPELKELINLADKNNIPLIYDEGSGNLTDKIVSEAPTIKEAIKVGVDIVLSSGDKLLGGPQAGLIIGKKRYIEAIRKNHLLRALRTGKLTYLALYATLTLYKEDSLKDIPNLQFITRGIDFLEKTADNLSSQLNEILGDKGKANVLDDISRVGGGTLPHLELPTRVVLVDISGLTPHSLRDKMRGGVPPVIGRLRDEGFVLDVRTLFEGDVEEIVGVVKEIID
jgi:L-seryl-tRNA(Ser) seleniumtransferase